eukprot:2913774-Rhodomonas_salina.2
MRTTTEASCRGHCSPLSLQAGVFGGRGALKRASSACERLGRGGARGLRMVGGGERSVWCGHARVADMWGPCEQVHAATAGDP